MKYCIFLLILASYGKSFGQFKEIPVSKIQSLSIIKAQCIRDSTVGLTTFCEMDLDGLYINVYSAFFDVKLNELRIIGRVCASPGRSSSGLPDVDIFKSKKKGSVLGKRIEVGESTYSKNFLGNNGFFDVTFKVEKGESLFFYLPGYFIGEYAVFKLLKN